MTERMEHFDEDLDLVPARRDSKLAEDLDALFKPQFSVPPEIDRAVLDRAARHFAGRKFPQGEGRRFRWAALLKVAAAAAVAIFAFSLNLTNKPAPTVHYADLAKAGAFDFDRSGRVDILDAFKLARQIELASNTGTDLDINGDGLINRDDVDVVALAAVSLDKGVL
jgi:hypothetical protein